jgi:hypothetical protein
LTIDYSVNDRSRALGAAPVNTGGCRASCRLLKSLGQAEAHVAHKIIGLTSSNGAYEEARICVNSPKLPPNDLHEGGVT